MPPWCLFVANTGLVPMIDKLQPTCLRCSIVLVFVSCSIRVYTCRSTRACAESFVSVCIGVRTCMQHDSHLHSTVVVVEFLPYCYCCGAVFACVCCTEKLAKIEEKLCLYIHAAQEGSCVVYIPLQRPYGIVVDVICVIPPDSGWCCLI